MYWKIMEIAILGILGALAAIMANRGIAVFNDGLRPVIPQYLDGKIDKKALAATSFALGFGLVIGFGIPVSIGATIILIHSILLATDIIGTWSPKGIKGVVIAGCIGAIYGVALVMGLQYIVDFFKLLPVNMMEGLSKIGAPVIVSFAVFPALAVGYQHGFKKGAMSFVATLLMMVLVKRFGVFTFSSDVTLKLSPEGVALLTGMIFMVVFSMQIKGEAGKQNNQNLLNIFGERVKKIHANWWILAIMGGLISAATSLSLIAGDPISQKLMVEGLMSEAALAAFARSIGFVPLVFSTAIVTGVYGPAGTTLVFVFGILLQGKPFFAFGVGFIIMVLEIFLLEFVGKGLDKFPGVREMGEYIRTSMNQVLEVGLLIGGAMASEAMAPGIGYFWVIGVYLLNKRAPKPLVALAVGPVAAISLGIIMNVLTWVGLWIPIVPA